MRIQNALFYLLIFSLLLNISSCKKVFDKDYYKDCVGEDKVSGDAIGLIKASDLNSAVIYSRWTYELPNTIECPSGSEQVCKAVLIVKKDSIAVFKSAVLSVIDTNSGLYSKIQDIDSSRQSIVRLAYFTYPEPTHPYYFVSNLYHVNMDTITNQLVVFYERRKPTKGTEKLSLSLELTFSYLIINKVIDENTKLTLTYFQNKCN